MVNDFIQIWHSPFRHKDRIHEFLESCHTPDKDCYSEENPGHPSRNDFARCMFGNFLGSIFMAHIVLRLPDFQEDSGDNQGGNTGDNVNQHDVCCLRGNKLCCSERSSANQGGRPDFPDNVPFSFVHEVPGWQRAEVNNQEKKGS